VRKRQRRLSDVEDLVVSLVAKGLTTEEVQAHLAEIYGAEVSRQTISAITDRVLDSMAEWQQRPLDAVDPVLFIDAIAGQDPRRTGRQPARVRGPGRHGGW
jgi:putative transposase